MALCLACSETETEGPGAVIDAGRDDGSSVDAGGDSGACPDLEGSSVADAIAMSTGACHSQSAIGARLSTTDVDYYTFRATPAADCEYSAQARLGGAWEPGQLCFFAECDSGGTATCAVGTPSSEGGTFGCCSSDGLVKLTLECTAPDSAYDAFVRFEVQNRSECAEYTVSLSY
jgi:hypothetical protein